MSEPSKDKTGVMVKAIKCPECQDILYSRAGHDFRRCTCGAVFVDGGFEYLRYGFKDIEPEILTLEVPVSKKDLYDDWNHSKNQYGLIRPS